MRLLIKFLFLVSFGSVSMADDGDVYFSTTDEHFKVEDKGRKNYKEKINFKIEGERISFSKKENIFDDTRFLKIGKNNTQMLSASLQGVFNFAFSEQEKQQVLV